MRDLISAARIRNNIRHIPWKLGDLVKTGNLETSGAARNCFIYDHIEICPILVGYSYLRAAFIFLMVSLPQFGSRCMHTRAPAMRTSRRHRSESILRYLNYICRLPKATLHWVQHAVLHSYRADACGRYYTVVCS
jgi:hypothetical protein